METDRVADKWHRLPESAPEEHEVVLLRYADGYELKGYRVRDWFATENGSGIQGEIVEWRPIQN